MLAVMNHNLLCVIICQFQCSTLQTMGGQPKFVDIFSKPLETWALSGGRSVKSDMALLESFEVRNYPNNSDPENSF